MNKPVYLKNKTNKVFCNDCKYCYNYYNFYNIKTYECENENNIEIKYSPVFGKMRLYEKCEKLNSNYDCKYFKKKNGVLKNLWKKIFN